MEQLLGAGAAAIQILGNGNTAIIVGSEAASFTLERPHRTKWAPEKEGDLLALYVRATDLVGRDADLAALRAWLAGPRPVACRCLTARAGAGKTRLAIEICASAEADGWDAGFLTQERLAAFAERPTLGEWRWGRATLVVVDYAAASAAALRRWLDALARRAPGDPPLRLLLLERHADTQFGWWADLARPGGLSTRGAVDLLDAGGPVPLPGLARVEDRRALLRQVVDAAAALRGVAAPAVPAAGAEPAFDRLLADGAIEHEPLFLIMAGLVALTTGVPAALSLGRTDLAFRVAASEGARLDRLAASVGLDAGEFRHMAACVTLQGGCTRSEAVALVEGERAALGSKGGATEAVTRRLAEAFPSPGSAAVDAMRPDLIGEAFVLDHLTSGYRGGDEQRAVILRAFRRARRPVLAILVRTAQDHAGGNPDHAAVAWLAYLVDGVSAVSTLMDIGDAMPQPTLALSGIAALAEGRIAKALRAIRRGGGKEAEQLVERFGGVASPTFTSRKEVMPSLSGRQVLHAYLAGTLNNLSFRLANLKRRKSALRASIEAVSLYRELADEHLETFGPELARALNNLSNRLADLAQAEAALAAISEAVSIRRAFAGLHPAAFTVHLARSLINLSNRLSDLDRREAALRAVEEAAALLRASARAHSNAFASDLADALDGLSVRLSSLGRYGPALSASAEAVTLYRVAASVRSDAFLPDLARSLRNLSRCQAGLERRDAALEAIEEAVALYRALAGARPGAFGPDLALSLWVLADRLDEGGDREGGLAANVEAVTTLSGPFQRLPSAFSPRMSGMIQDYIQRCEALGRAPDEALIAPLLATLSTLDDAPETPPMMDALAAAASAVALVTPALVEVGKGSAKKVGETAADGVLGWLRAKATDPSREALADLEAAPAAEDNQADLRKRLAKLLAERPELLDELRALLSAGAPAEGAQGQTLGAGAKGIQVRGDNNTSSIG